MYENVTFEDILDRMLERVPEDVDKREGSVIYDALASAAVELQLMYIELDVILRETFADTASRKYLLRRAAERGIKPKAAVKAVLKGEFVPDTLEIPAGSRFSCDDLNYTLKEKISDGRYSLECETEGVLGNSVLGRLTPVDYINGLEMASVTEVLVPGEEEEETESVRERYFASFTAQAFGGNKRDYIQKTLEIQGVGAVKVTPVWNGGGTVKITILNSEHDIASAYLLDQVQQKLDPVRDGGGDGLAPIGHVVTVDTPKEFAVDITLEVVYDTGYNFESLGSKVSKAVDDYLKEVRQGWSQAETMVIRKAQIETRIMGVSGIIDVSRTMLNGKEENIILDKTYVPVLGEVTA